MDPTTAEDWMAVATDRPMDAEAIASLMLPQYCFDSD